MSSGYKNTIVYVSNVSNSIRKKDLYQEFSKYGYINSIDLNNGFAFVEYKNYRDANAAIAVDGKIFKGQKLIVQHACKK